MPDYRCPRCGSEDIRRRTPVTVLHYCAKCHMNGGEGYFRSPKKITLETIMQEYHSALEDDPALKDDVKEGEG